MDKDPAKRWTCDQLLTHVYFDNFNFKIEDNETQNFEKNPTTRDKSRVSILY